MAGWSGSHQYLVLWLYPSPPPSGSPTYSPKAHMFKKPDVRTVEILTLPGSRLGFWAEHLFSPSYESLSVSRGFSCLQFHLPGTESETSGFSGPGPSSVQAVRSLPTLFLLSFVCIQRRKGHVASRTSQWLSTWGHAKGCHRAKTFGRLNLEILCKILHFELCIQPSIITFKRTTI